MTLTATPSVAIAKRFAPAGDYFYFKHRPDHSLPAEPDEDLELEEYASPT